MECFGNSFVGTSGVNGDRFYISKDGTTIALSDGASGAGKDGKVLMSECCIRNIEEAPFSKSGLSVEKYIQELIWKINNDLIKLSQQRNKYVFGTLIICVINDGIVTFASVGDSTAFLISKGTIKRVAKGKKTYDILVQLGLFTDEQIEEYVHSLPEQMWSMFDTFIPSVVPKYAQESYRLEKQDMILICCDGISDYLDGKELLKLISSDNLEKSVNTIINKARDKSIESHGKNQYDDLTLVIYKV